MITGYMLNGGSVIREEGKFALAQEMFKKAVRLSGGDFGVYMELAALYRGLGRYAEAQEAIKDSLVIEPLSRLAYTELGWCYSDDGKAGPRAEEAFRKVIEFYPDDSSNYMELGRFYRSQRRNNEAEKDVPGGIAFSRGRGDVMGVSGTCRLLLRKKVNIGRPRIILKRQSAAIREAIRLILNSEVIIREKGDYLKAEEMFNKALEVKENNPEIYNYLGSLNQLLGRGRRPKGISGGKDS